MRNKISVAQPNLIGKEEQYVLDCLQSTWISSNGQYINKFENSFSAYMQTRNSLACANGTVALHLPLLALGLKPGDEVLIPSLTYIATANTVRYCGATPVFVDCDPNTWNIDPEDAKKKINSKTVGIMPVHLYGNPCDMDALMTIAEDENLFIVEDAAECHGAEYKGKKAGTFGKAGIFSFFGNKIITTGEGGMVVTDDDELAHRMRILKGQGMDPARRYWFIDVGYNYRMTNIEAAIGLAQLENIQTHIAERERVAKAYEELLAPHLDLVQPQRITPNSKNVWWMYSILISKNARISRDELILALDKDGIETRPLFYPMHVMPPYYSEHADCPVSEDVASRGLNLPTHAQLTPNDLEYIVDRVVYHLT